MTIEELCECDAATLEKMTDAELLTHFQKYLNVTRPEKAAKERVIAPPKAVAALSDKERAVFAMLQSQGIDTAAMIKRRTQGKK